MSRISLTTEELEIFEALLERAFWSGGTFFYDASVGRDHLQEIISSSDKLNHRLSRKWFPNIEAIWFLRQNLVKINMRAYAALGATEKLKACEKKLEQFGATYPDDLKEQIQYLSLISRYSILLRLCNAFVKGGVFFCTLLLGKKRGRRDSNPQLLP